MARWQNGYMTTWLQAKWLMVRWLSAKGKVTEAFIYTPEAKGLGGLHVSAPFLHDVCFSFGFSKR